MENRILYSFILLVFLLSKTIFSQEALDESEQWLKIDNDLMFSLVIVADKDQNVTKGLLYGIKGDSLYISTRYEMISLNFNNLQTVSIENRKGNYHATALGALSGMYFGTTLFLTAKEQPAKYLEYDEIVSLAFIELLFASIGGGVGYLIDISEGFDQEVFYFNQAENGIDSEIKKLIVFLTNSSESKKIKVNFHFSQVKTRLSEIQDNSDQVSFSQNYQSNFNMLRKISVTYEFFENLEIGLTFSWYGEPDFYLYKYGYPYRTNNTSQSYDGMGYYVIANYKPLKNMLKDNFEIMFGAGIGVGKIDFNFKAVTVTHNYPPAPAFEINEININKIVFSFLLNAEIKYYIYSGLSVSIQADYIYIPGKMPAILEYELDERSLGNFSFGMGMGINF